MTIHIDVVDQSTRGGAHDFEKYVHACQTQVRYDVAPAWGTGNSAFIRLVKSVAPGHWPVYILDDSDVDGALGYHETDDLVPTLPVGKVFVKTDEKYGLEPSVTLSHEIVEIIGDPMAQLTFQATATQFWALELCDAVEADQFGYVLEGVLVSDFVTPQWFFGAAKGDLKPKFSYTGAAKKMRTLTPGGYQAYMDTRTGRWTQITAESAPGVNTRAMTMGRNPERRVLQALAEAIPQPSVSLP